MSYRSITASILACDEGHAWERRRIRKKLAPCLKRALSQLESGNIDAALVEIRLALVELKA